MNRRTGSEKLLYLGLEAISAGEEELLAGMPSHIFSQLGVLREGVDHSKIDASSFPAVNTPQSACLRVVENTRSILARIWGSRPGQT
jgi:hypothetical protein